MAPRIVLVGCGNMGYSMLAGWLAADIIPNGDVLVVELNEQLRERVSALRFSENR